MIFVSNATALLDSSPIVIVMGVSGSGKSTVGEMLAKQLNWQFQEGDALHPPANVAKMSNGIPLDDDDRLPWLHTIGKTIDEWRACDQSGVVTCSALKKTYRTILAGERSNILFVYLKGDASTIGPRLAGRHGHYMPPALLSSQFETLEEPAADEQCLTLSVASPPDVLVQGIIQNLRQDEKYVH